ncbi:hypothetical protein O7627_25175 [Solwaraspora sp. WMMD1047]|uniref:hypothetical protein n=1 Tax=Solwaraspora sp. WMMD1047 TaxID=3016102 RepID=UPI002416622A|nr:hypothetical protein [Solwaraspora sp. WMMD1047]MDG4832577.1 hypothetical protein [Solwaraspora sp. WMMD1047]
MGDRRGQAARPLVGSAVDRRIAALFFGIVAIGLGPAVWLGGTMLRTEPAPRQPAPSVISSVSPVPTGQAAPTPGELAPTADPAAGADGGAVDGGAAGELPDDPVIVPSNPPRPPPPVLPPRQPPPTRPAVTPTPTPPASPTGEPTEPPTEQSPADSGSGRPR